MSKIGERIFEKQFNNHVVDEELKPLVEGSEFVSSEGGEYDLPLYPNARHSDCVFALEKIKAGLLDSVNKIDEKIKKLSEQPDQYAAFTFKEAVYEWGESDLIDGTSLYWLLIPALTAYSNGDEQALDRCAHAVEIVEASGYMYGDTPISEDYLEYLEKYVADSTIEFVSQEQFEGGLS